MAKRRYKCNSYRASAFGPSGSETDLQEALFASKVDAFAQEYNHLLVSQLDSQRQYFEGLLRSREVQREAVEARAVLDNSLLQLKAAQAEGRLHLQSRKNTEKKLVGTTSSAPLHS